MAKRENILPYAPLGEIIHQATGKRVSKEAKVAAEKILDEVAGKVVYKANLLAQNSNRKTIKGKDVSLAYQQVKEEL